MQMVQILEIVQQWILLIGPSLLSWECTEEQGHARNIEIGVVIYGRVSCLCFTYRHLSI